MNRSLLLLLLVSAPAMGAVTAEFSASPEAVSAKLANRCIDKNFTVELATTAVVICAHPMARAASVYLSFIAGISLTDPPIIRDRYTIIPNGDTTRVQGSTQIEAKRKNGTDYTMRDEDGQADAAFKSMFIDIGGAVQ